MCGAYKVEFPLGEIKGGICIGARAKKSLRSFTSI